MSNFLANLSQHWPQFNEPYQDLKELAFYMALGIFLLGFFRIISNIGGRCD